MIGDDDPAFVPTRSTILSELTVLHMQLLVLAEHARIAIGVGNAEHLIEDAMYATGKAIQQLGRHEDG